MTLSSRTANFRRAQIEHVERLIVEARERGHLSQVRALRDILRELRIALADEDRVAALIRTQSWRARGRRTLSVVVSTIRRLITRGLQRARARCRVSSVLKRRT